MMTRVIPRVIICLGLALGLSTQAGCAEKLSKRCEEVCQREADCADQLDDDEVTVNKGECVRECNKLEREPGGPALVTEHIQCVNGTNDCRAVLECR